MWRLIYFIPSWLIFLAFRTLMIALGWLLIPVAAFARAYEAYDAPHWQEGTRRQYRFTWAFMWPWDNEEDGIADPTYWTPPAWVPKSLQLPVLIIYWSALRNPANNLRYVDALNVKIRGANVNYIGSLASPVELRQYDDDSVTFWSLTWHGLYSNIRVHFRLGSQIWRFWLGWKIYPHDIVEPVTDHRKDGAGFATQLKRIWPKD